MYYSYTNKIQERSFFKMNNLCLNPLNVVAVLFSPNYELKKNLKFFAPVNLLRRFELKWTFKNRSKSNVKFKKFADMLLVLLLHATSTVRLSTNLQC